MPQLTIPNLFARRSIRKFVPKPVTAEQVDMLLQAAMAAPSAADRKPWHFIVVQSQELLSKLAASHPYAKMLPQAAVCIVPCGEPALSGTGREGYWIQDLSAATENVLLAATGMGLGSVWLGVYPTEDRVAPAREILGIPEDIYPLCYIAIGYPDEAKEARTQYDAERVHNERW